MEIKKTDTLDRGTAIIVVPIDKPTEIHSIMTECVNDVVDYMKVLKVGEMMLGKVVGTAMTMYGEGCRKITLIPTQYATDILVIV